MKKLIVLITIMVALFATTVAQATFIANYIFASDIVSMNANPDDASWNAQFFPGKGSSPDEQFSAGLGLDEVASLGTSVFAEDPGSNDFTVEISSGGFLGASLNSDIISLAAAPILSTHSVVLYIDDDVSSFPSDNIEITNLQINGNLLPDLSNSGSPSIVGFRIYQDTFENFGSSLTITGTINFSFVESYSNKDFLIKTVGLTTVPEPSSVVLLISGLITLVIIGKICN